MVAQSSVNAVDIVAGLAMALCAFALIVALVAKRDEWPPVLPCVDCGFLSESDCD
jgi:hypothetical protein